MSTPPSPTSIAPRAWQLAFLGLTLALAFTSLILADKPGMPFLVAYLILLPPILYALVRGLLPRLDARHDRWAVAAALLTLGGLTAAFLFVHPQLDQSGLRIAGMRFGSSDADDALEVALDALLQGQYPYYARTFLNNPLSPLPGALLLALPFHLLGNAALQNFFWLAVFVIVAARQVGSVSRGVALLLLTLGLAPNVIFHLLQGSDYTANNVYVLVFVLAVTTAATRDGARVGKATVGSAVLLGIGLATRANFLLLIPLLYAYLVRRIGPRAAAWPVGIALFTFATIILPFYLYDPAGFSPLHTTTLAGDNPTLPLAAAGLLTLALAFIPLSTPARLLHAIFWPQFVLIGLSMVTFSHQEGLWVDGYARYGLLILFFAVLGCGAELLRPSARPG